MPPTTLTPDTETATTTNAATAPAPEDAPVTTTTDRDAQRATLRDLVSLATEVATTESEIERRYRAEVEEESKKHKRIASDTANKFNSLREQVKNVRQQAVATVMAAFNASAGALKGEHDETRRKLESKSEATVSEVKNKYNQAVWMADSVLENEQNGIAVEFKTAKDAIEGHVRELDAMQAQARKLLQTYKAKAADLDSAGIDPQAEQKDAGPAPAQAAGVYEAERAKADALLHALGGLFLPRLFIGATPFLILVMIIAAGAAVPLIVKQSFQLDVVPMAAAAGGALVVTIVLGVLLRGMGQRKIRATYVPFRDHIAAARRATAAELVHAQQNRDARTESATKHRKAEVARAKEKYAPYLNEATRKRDAAMATIVADYKQKLAKVEAVRDRGLKEAEEAERVQLAEVKQREDRETQKVVERHTALLRTSKQRYEEARTALLTRLHGGLQRLQVPMAGAGAGMPIDWNDGAWHNYKSPTVFPSTVRFGELRVDLRQISDSDARNAAAAAANVAATARRGSFGDNTHSDGDGDGDGLHASNGNGNGNGNGAAALGTSIHNQLPPAFSVPAVLAFPKEASLLIQADRDARGEALRVLQMVMARLLTSLPAGRVRFTIIDPIGRGENFAGFMHLADHDDALVGSQILTEQDQIEQRLADLTKHMETVIQKYLRNEYETIDEYNQQAGELAEPYRVLVIADFPAGFSEEAAKRLASIANSGARCGVYTLVMRDTRESMSGNNYLDEVERNSANIVRDGDHFIWKDEVFGRFPLTLDAPPSEAVLTKLLDVVGKGAKLAKRVELPFDTIAPTPDKLWSMSSASEMGVPVGRQGATKLQSLRLGKGVAQHVLIAGKTGSGKSTLLHAMVTNLAMWYSPDEVEFYLVDFKKGVEFKTYATHRLPHARAIAVESDREFGLSVLQRLDAELTRRGNLFRAAGTQDLAAYRASAGALRMPRTLLMIDEFQEFFSEDDKVAQEAGVLIDRLVRQGRAFGIHVMLGSQTIGGSSGLNRSTLGQMAVRIALMTSDADSQLILGDNNSAARLLSRPGEAIYNDAGGLVEGNSPFQVAWLPDPKREIYLDQVHQRAIQMGIEGRDPLVVFEGNAPADLTKNNRLMELINAPTYPANVPAPTTWLGDPVAIKDATAVPFRRQSGANILIVGQQDEEALALMTTAMVSLATQLKPSKASFYVFDGTAADSDLSGTFNRVAAAIPHETKNIEYRLTAEGINEIAQEVARRQAGGAETDSAPAIFVLIYGLQRFRNLRKSEDSSFSFGGDDAEKPPAPDKQFNDILREGPALGVHVITWADTPATLDRTFDRNAMREFDNRVLFQMSANDSSNLIDNPAANKLGANRALAFSEEQGVMEKFRPYAVPSAEFLAEVRAKLANKAG